MKTVHLKTKEIRSRDELADLLQQLADQIAEGTLVFRQGAEETRLEMPSSVRLSVEVVDEEKPATEQKPSTGTKREVEVEISWRVGEDGPIAADEPLTLG